MQFPNSKFENPSQLQKILKQFSGTDTTAFYLYHLQTLRSRLQFLKQSLPPSSAVRYAMKANHRPEILKEVAAQGFGVDVVSAGELRCALAVGIEASKIVFSGVGKTVTEIDFAIHQGVQQLNIESVQELARILERFDTLKKIIPFSFRINPDVHAQTAHPGIQTGGKTHKFGLSPDAFLEALDLFKRWTLKADWSAFEKKAYQGQIKVISEIFQGLSCHIGSQILSYSDYKKVFPILRKAWDLCQEQGFALSTLNLGGGWGIPYHQEDSEFELVSYCRWVADQLHDFSNCKQLIFEPGRWLVGPTCVLVTRIEYVKKQENNFIILNSGMNDFIRPALYGSYHHILHFKKTDFSFIPAKKDSESYNLVGPICESTDELQKNVVLDNPESGDFIVLCDVGAYGECMMNDYNLRERAKVVCI